MSGQGQFDKALAGAAARVAAAVDTVLPPAADSNVAAAMRHAALSGGKRLRALLVIEGARLHDLPRSRADLAAAAVELLHAYSLVHDDLPAMDDDDLRRGQPTVHVKWDEATAILAGDALQSLAFGVLARIDGPPERVVRLVAGLAQAAGAQGMVLGQALDIAAETATVPLDQPQITRLQSLKTGALIRWSATAGPVLAGADPAPLDAFAQALGLAFQIADDILDVTGDAVAAGKRLGKDAGAGKATFVSLLGVQGARALARSLAAQAEAALEPYGAGADVLRQAAQYTITRRH